MKYFDEFYESLWANIHKKRQRIKKGSGEKMRKKGEKGAPTPAQMQRAKGESIHEKGHTEFAKTNTDHKREKEQLKVQHDREKDRARERDTARKNIRTEAPSLAVLKKKIKSGTKLGSTETSSAKARGLIPRADGTKRKSPKYKQQTTNKGRATHQDEEIYMLTWLKNRMMEIHNWGGVGMIAVGVMILLGSSFIDWVAYATIAYGLYSIWHGMVKGA